jgi:hypothetical protein
LRYLVILFALLTPALSQEVAAVDPSLPINHDAEDLIGMIPQMSWIIGPPLEHAATHCAPHQDCIVIDEYETLRQAVLKREAENAANFRCFMGRADVWCQMGVWQRAAYDHVMDGKPLRAGDFQVLHGMLLTARQPNTFALEKHWQKLMDCVPPKQADPSCVGY